MDWELCWVTKVGHEDTGTNAYHWIEFTNRKTDPNEQFSSYADGNTDMTEVQEGDSILVLHDRNQMKSIRHAGKQIWFRPEYNE
jgi:hypothetical protein